MTTKCPICGKLTFELSRDESDSLCPSIRWFWVCKNKECIYDRQYRTKDEAMTAFNRMQNSCLQTPLNGL